MSEGLGAKVGGVIVRGRNTHKLLRVGGGIGGALTTFVGVWSLIGISFDIKMIVNAFYLVIMGFFMVMVQLRIEKIMKKFELLRNYTGLGFYYIFVAGLSLGTSWFDWALALFLALIGVVYLYLSLCKGIKHAPSNYEFDSRAPTEGTEQGAGAPQRLEEEGSVRIEMKERDAVASPSSSATPSTAKTSKAAAKPSAAPASPAAGAVR